MTAAPTTNRLSALLLAAAIACTISVSALPAAAEDIVAPDHTRQREILRLLKQDCSACHGMRLTEGLGQALTPDALKDRPASSLVATIAYGRPDTAMGAAETPRAQARSGPTPNIPSVSTHRGF